MWEFLESQPPLNGSLKLTTGHSLVRARLKALFLRFNRLKEIDPVWSMLPEHNFIVIVLYVTAGSFTKLQRLGHR